MSGFKIQEVAQIIRDAGGQVVGRTRLQKIAYLFFATGLDDSFRFAYKHYGPFSEDLASSAKIGALVGEFEERQEQASWGGTYSTYSADTDSTVSADSARQELARLCTSVDSVVLELAATAVFLSHDGYPDPWQETTNRKPDKSTADRVARAKSLLSDLAKIETPVELPAAAVA